MGKIKVLGSAEREVECDCMQINLSFGCIGKNQKEAQAQVMKECETFLRIIKGQKLDISLRKDYLAEVSLKENVRGYRTEKEIIIQGKYDATLINVIHEICLKKGFTVTLDVSMKLSKEREQSVRKELLSEALQQSKEEAMAIMQSEGKTCIEIASVDREDRYHRNYAGDSGCFGGSGGFDEDYFEETLAMVKTNYSSSNEIKAKKEKLQEEIVVVWKIS